MSKTVLNQLTVRSFVTNGLAVASDQDERLDTFFGYATDILGDCGASCTCNRTNQGIC